MVDKTKVPTAADLKGKTVGVSTGTSSEIILGLVLRDAGLTEDDITKVEMDVSGMTTASSPARSTPPPPGRPTP